MLVVGCDLALGPLISLVIYNSRKSRRELLTDYAIVGALQLAALVYGVNIVAGTRPVYVAFSVDRFEVVSARDITSRGAAPPRSPPNTARCPGRARVSSRINVPPADSNDALFQALAGNEVQQRPKFYVPFETELDAIRSHARTVADLTRKFPAYGPQLESAAKSVGDSAGPTALVAGPTITRYSGLR